MARDLHELLKNQSSYYNCEHKCHVSKNELLLTIGQICSFVSIVTARSDYYTYQTRWKVL